MNQSFIPDVESDEASTVVITHRVCNEKHADYEKWLEEIGPFCKESPGHLDWHIVRPISGLSETYTIIVRFDTKTHLKDWIDSQTRADLIEKVRPLLVTGDDFYISSGLDFWFTPEGAKAKVPVRWKQFLTTWSAIYPLVLAVPLFVISAFRYFRIPNYHFLTTFAVTGIVVALMAHVIMPRYTKLIHRWLFN